MARPDHSPVEGSTNINTTSYDPEDQTLEVAFHSGSTYRYHGVTPDEHDTFQQAESKGQWVHQNFVKQARAVTKL